MLVIIMLRCISFVLSLMLMLVIIPVSSHSVTSIPMCNVVLLEKLSATASVNAPIDLAALRAYDCVSGCGWGARCGELSDGRVNTSMHGPPVHCRLLVLHANEGEVSYQTRSQQCALTV